mmetsp:Transcript_13336/g.28322  ORF Transcript_13336/g.28322 Transcript_13336/m.28322 type:complete len:229 (-) Transcript_13336:190-876(-)|eukprot:CAMPEP_0118940702 /NCGR_PEP_ID=MMETSP1169-20130426/32061_1 /TAXON_ID=36882 /ORGANISM="Pyramimonas obovata, Strain CCMP722" /LENGTH=228 /DNA_ID=CAMNT_0006885261 /DNA_START=101 /DNA_END=790 /DNA_ORIENTATION=+
MKTIETLLFDLDGTLYPACNGYQDHCHQNIFRYMVDKLGFEDMKKAEVFWRDVFKKYNQTIRGLRAGGYEVDADDFWGYIREGPEKFLSKDPDVRVLLESLPQKKYIFTNCAEKQALQALEAMGIADCFEKDIFGSYFMDEVCKPEPAAFAKVFEHCKIDPHTTAFFEDSLKNIKTAKSLGMTTVLITGRTLKEEDGQQQEVEAVVDAVVQKPGKAEVQAALPWLWPQ